MKELEFRGLEISDFKEFVGAHSINLAKLGLGVHFVSGDNQVEPRLGSNGAGKSSIWDALCWCLFGRTISGLRGTDIRTWSGKEPAFARVKVLVDGDPHIITRSTKTNGVWIDEKVCEQAAIDELLGLSYAIFPHTILLGQGEPLFFDLKPTEKMSLLSEALNLDRWEERSKGAKKRTDLADRDLSEMKGKIDELERSEIAADASVTDLEKRSEDWEAEQAKVGTADKKLMDTLRKALANAAKLMGDADLKLDGAETEARATQKALTAHINEIGDVASTIGATSAAVQVLLDNLDDLKKAKTCPTCGQALPKGSDAHMAEKRRKMTDELDISRSLLVDLNKSKEQMNAKRTKLTRELGQFQAKADDARDSYTRAKSDHADLDAKIKATEKLMEAAANSTNPYSELLKKARLQVRRIGRLVEELDDLILTAEAERARSHYWVGGFKQVRLYSLQEVLEELTAVTQTLLPQIGLEDWIIEYSMERETQAGKTLPGLNVNIFKPGQEKPVKWESWSGGEGQRLRLIGAIALSEVLLRRSGVETDLLILDEPTRHLSPEGVDEMVDFLCDRGHDYQIFYIDHQAIETTRFARGLHVIKDKRGSRIEL